MAKAVVETISRTTTSCDVCTTRVFSWDVQVILDYTSKRDAGVQKPHQRSFSPIRNPPMS